MRRIAWYLLLIYVFAIPWEYSLDLGAPLGNVARIVGVLLLLAAIPGVFEAGRTRTPGPLLWLALAYFLWFCCSYFWTVAPAETLTAMRGYFQEILVVWLVWEFAESPGDLRDLLRAWVAGSWVLALLTLASLASPEAIAAGQYRFAAVGQDPNDMARYLDLGFPMAALLLNSEQRWPGRLLAAGYFPVGLSAVVVTASRGGFMAALVALAGCALLLGRAHPRRVLLSTVGLLPMAGILWLAVPRETFERLATISEQLNGGDLNQRWNIWDSGWHAFVHAPLFGTGAGTFVVAAGTATADTAHNTALSIAVTGGLCALFLAVAILAMAIWAAEHTRGPLQVALFTSLLVLVLASLTATVEENRTTWLLLALIALAGRLAAEDGERLDACFPARLERPEFSVATEPVL